MKYFAALTLVLVVAVDCADQQLGRLLRSCEAKVGEAPYIVLFKDDNLNLFCAGVIIYPNWVLTAGHCLVLNSFRIYAGIHAVDGYNDPAVQMRRISSPKYYIRHDYYTDALDSVDLGLVYIAEPFDFKSPRVSNIALETGKCGNNQGRVYGWGIVSGGGYPKNLQVAKVKILDYRFCWRLFKRQGPLMSYNLCNKPIDGPCRYDSGGPLVHDTPEGERLVGITSWGFVPCDGRTTPPVYMNITQFIDWIASTTTTFVAPKS